MNDQNPKKSIHYGILVIALSFSMISGCASTRTQDGVTIEQKRNLNPLQYIPGF